MFTGLVQAIGEISRTSERAQGREFRIDAKMPDGEYVLGESISVDGCCLTVETFDGDGFTVFASPETLQKTTLGDRVVGTQVNLERALAVGDRLGGHIVSGHVDGTGKFREAINNGDSWEVWIDCPANLLSQSIPKGSISVDGISLTLVDLTDDAFSLWIIPETWTRTTLSLRKPGDRVNLETDMFGKYVFRYLDKAIGEGQAVSDEKMKDLWARFNQS